MRNEDKPMVVVPKEEAVFRLDGNGVWHGENGKFENRRIIDYFHSMIKRDENGYYLEQEHKDFIEKVYFPFEETALFVFRVLAAGDRLTLVLNTGKKFRLEPGELFLKNDRLYLRRGGEVVKFCEEAMFKIAEYMEEASGRYVICCEGKRCPIRRREEGIESTGG